MRYTDGARKDVDCRGSRRVLVLVDGNMGNKIDTRIEQIIVDLQKIRENVNKAKECGPRLKVSLTDIAELFR